MKRDITELLRVWNRLTNPAVCLSDHEHNIRRKAARKVKRMIDNHPASYLVRESDHSGKLYI